MAYLSCYADIDIGIDCCSVLWLGFGTLHLPAFYGNNRLF